MCSVCMPLCVCVGSSLASFPREARATKKKIDRQVCTSIDNAYASGWVHSLDVVSADESPEQGARAKGIALDCVSQPGLEPVFDEHPLAPSVFAYTGLARLHSSVVLRR